MKPVASFADALKRLAEHVEQKNKTSKTQANRRNLHPLSDFFAVEMNSTGIASYIQSTADVPHRTMSSHSNSSMSPEETLRLYTQFIHEVKLISRMRKVKHTFHSSRLSAGKICGDAIFERTVERTLLSSMRLT